jgi:hypothetical protein
VVVLLAVVVIVVSGGSGDGLKRVRRLGFRDRHGKAVLAMVAMVTTTYNDGNNEGRHDNDRWSCRIWC